MEWRTTRAMHAPKSIRPCNFIAAIADRHQGCHQFSLSKPNKEILIKQNIAMRTIIILESHWDIDNELPRGYTQRRERSHESSSIKFNQQHREVSCNFKKLSKLALPCIKSLATNFKQANSLINNTIRENLKVIKTRIWDCGYTKASKISLIMVHR